MNVVDSSGWLEYFANASNAEFFSEPIEDTEHLLVPTLSLLEVYKRVLQQRGRSDALQAIALMRQGRVIDLDAALAVHAAEASVQLRLPMADSVMLATARRHQATLWTQDADFQHVPGVRYRSK